MHANVHSLVDHVLCSLEHPPKSASSGAENGTAIDMQGWEGVAFLVLVGAITGSGTLAGKVQTATDSAFTSPVDLTDAAITTVINSGANSLRIVEVTRTDDMLQYVRLVLTQGTAAVLMGSVAIRFRRNGATDWTAAATETVKVSG